MRGKQLKKVVAVAVSVAMTVMVAGCGSTQTEASTGVSTEVSTEAASTTVASTEVSEAESTTEDSGETMDAADVKVALILPGSANDKGWNEEAYDGLMEVQDLGCQVSYSENVAASDYESTFRGYAEQGFNFIIGHGVEFEDAATAVAPDFPDTMFCVTSSNISQSPNVCSLQNMNNQQGFLAGVVAALATKSHTVAAVGGMEVTSIQSYISGFEQGVAYVDNGTTALTAYTGDFDDATKVKEQAAAFIEQGADVVAQDADGAGLGLFEAVEEAGDGVYAIGSVSDQYDELPAQVLTSATNSIGDAIGVAVQQYLDGEIEAQCYQYGIAEGVIGLADYHDCSDVLTDDQKAYVEDVISQIASGDIVVENVQD